MKKKIYFVLVLLFGLSLGIYVAITAYHSDRLLSKSDLSGCTVYLHNINCDNFPEYEVYTVTDKTIVENLIENCVSAKKFRPFSMIREMILGNHENTPALIFEADDCLYHVNLLDVEKQLSLDYRYRDKPVILVEKEAIAKEATEEWTWYCILPADKYTTLLNMIDTYWDDTQPSVFSSLP